MNLWGFVDLRPKFLAKFIHQFEKSKHQVDAVKMALAIYYSQLILLSRRNRM